MAHDLQMREPKKVVARLEEMVDKIKKIQGTVTTVSEIGGMDLAIGDGLNKTFHNLESLNEPLEGAVQVVRSISSTIEDRAKEFERMNSDITF